MINYRFLTPAESEMNDALLFYDDVSSGLGHDFLDDIEHSLNRIREYPELGARIARDLRRILLQRFPFALVYAVKGETVVIVAVAHHGRRPGYWQSRLDR
jgi:toxin ParE1/3/4